MEVEKLMETLHLAEKLKDTLRHCTTSNRRPESVAEHSWRISLMAMLVGDEFPEADMNRVIRMCIIHDLGECFTGDIPVFKKTAEHERRERELLFSWVENLPEPQRTEFGGLYREMEERKTLEARIYKAMDSLEAVIQHNEAPLDTWEDHEYGLQRNYAYDRVEFSEYLKELRAIIRRQTEEKIAAGK